MDAECDDGGAISTVNALDPCAGVGPHDIIRRVCSTLSACRTTVAGVEHLRPADGGANSQFHFSCEYQLQQDHRHPPLSLGWRYYFTAPWCPEPVGSA